MSDQPDETVDTSDLTPPEPLTDEERAFFILKEIKRYSDNYAADNPPKEDERDE